MSTQKQVSVCLLAVLALQVLFASATPIKTDPNGKPQKDAAEDEVNQLQGRGLFDLVPNPTNIISGSVKSLDDNLRNVRSLGTKAVKSTIGSGLELTTGVNPIGLMDMPNELMKKAVRGARYGSDVAYNAADKALDTVQNLHDKKKQLVDDYVKPVAPTVLSDAMDQVHDKVDSTIETVKQGVQMGRVRVDEALANLEDRLERGESFLPTAFTDGIQSAEKAAASWLPSWGTSGAADAVAEEVKPVAKETVKYQPQTVPDPMKKPLQIAAAAAATLTKAAAPAARVANQAGQVTRSTAPQQPAGRLQKARSVGGRPSSSWLKR